MEIYNAKLHNLRYVQYEYTLEFIDILIDLDNLTAIVHLVESHDVVFEISEMIAENQPIVSKMRNLYHTIIVNKTQDGWKIALDTYDDYLWRILRSANISSEDLLLIMIDDVQGQTLEPVQIENITSLCDLDPDESTHPFDRSGVVAYAHRYALRPNPAYYYFPETDCTNFVNQAIHHGSNAEEVGSNTYGWYYNYYNNYEDKDYSSSWTDVQFLYNFITEYQVWNKGPEGCVITNDYAALEGDLIQFEWNGDTTWDHTVIIVEKEEDPYDPYNPYFYVAAHSSNLDNYPLWSIFYQSRRFVHIDRIDGYIKVYLPKVINTTGGLTANQLQSYQNPYPSPMENGISPETISPYPAP